uniref:Uncharacterized protein n=1 Tax=Anopheles dirus TaxID=7168 RepID=A0A182NW20_9DIPT
MPREIWVASVQLDTISRCVGRSLYTDSTITPMMSNSSPRAAKASCAKTTSRSQYGLTRAMSSSIMIM